MRLVVILGDILMSGLNRKVKRAFLFDAHDNKITAVGEELILINDINYVCLWLLGKQVNVVYYDDFSNEEKDLLERVGIIVRPTDDMDDNEILKGMLLKYVPPP